MDDLTWETYIEEALATAADQPPELQLAQAALGMAGELAEVAAADLDGLADECGDCWWYVALAADVLDGDDWLRHRPGRVRSSGDEIAAELCEAVETRVFQGDECPVLRFRISELCREYTWWLMDVAPEVPIKVWRRNLEKLRERHGDSFSPADEQVRDE